MITNYHTEPLYILMIESAPDEATRLLL